MRAAPRTFFLRDGRQVVVRSAGEEDAAALLEERRITSGETEFMVRYPDEITATAGEEAGRLRALAADGQEFLLLAVAGGAVVASAGVNRVGERDKLRHRGMFGVSVRRDWWGGGLGGFLTRECIRLAGEAGFEQLELDVFRENRRARQLYISCGFREWGCLPRAFRLRSGEYADGIHMLRELP